ncbi:unnamed protein product [Ambrosiozyma monospora]|uniref:Unnamed protein product n=1 Tax=Ambrosiozyma monospora TaxID=43982 RepID=A0ACB5U200_AMBMO|nr:unnamed protein product [Ambrosiozyma monospora]
MKTLSIIKSQDDVDLTSMTWHPVHTSTLTIGGYDGSLSSYDLLKSIDPQTILSSSVNSTSSTTSSTSQFKHKSNHNRTSSSANANFSSSTTTTTSDTTTTSKLIHRIPYAHERAIYTLEYHPLGHMLCTAGADKSMRFWARARPNDKLSFMDSAYTGESWAEKQQSMAIRELAESKPNGSNAHGGLNGNGNGGSGGDGNGSVNGHGSGGSGMAENGDSGNGGSGGSGRIGRVGFGGRDGHGEGDNGGSNGNGDDDDAGSGGIPGFGGGGIPGFSNS